LCSWAKRASGLHFGLLQRRHGGHDRLGDVGRLQRLALLVVVFHPQHVGLDQQDRLVLADDAVFQVAHQRRLAGAVRADQRSLFALAQGKRDIAYGLNTAVMHVHTFHLQ